MRRRTGLTIVELLVVLAILALLIAVATPAVLSMRERALETTCKNNLHQLNLAMARYADAHDRLPRPPAPGTIGGWMVGILPFLEQENLQETVPIGRPLTEAPESLNRPPQIFLCPRREALDGEQTAGVTFAHYIFVPAGGRESFLLYDAPTDLREPWLAGPETTMSALNDAIGPHHGGFHFARGFQQGVDFQPGGK